MISRVLDILLGPAATAVKQAAFGPISQLIVYAPFALWFVAHKDESFVCLTYAQTGLGILLVAWAGWILTRRRPAGDA
jgi:hypothetical protein